MISQNPNLVSEDQKQSIVTLLDDVEGLVSPPDVCMRLFELIHSPTTGAKQIAEVINLDPNLTARLLRMANSCFPQADDCQVPMNFDELTRANMSEWGGIEH